MGLLSFFQRRKDNAVGASRAAESADTVAAARTRARRRLMGAAVLVMAGVIGFPLVFETQPRPIPVDIPIEIPRKDGAAGLAMPPARPAPAPARASGVSVAPRDEVLTETPADAGKPVAAPLPASAPVAKAPVAEPATKPATKPAAAAKPASAPDTARAKALLEGKEPAKAQTVAAKSEAARDGGRFVVQVGAFADPAAARETRGKLEKLGLKSYTQAVETASGNRIRVRAGPFDSRDEADKALAKARAAGLTAVVLTL